MKLKEYLQKEDIGSLRRETGKTTKDKGHDHDYIIDRGKEDGGTSKDKGNMHKIKAMVVLKENGHSHGLKTVD